MKRFAKMIFDGKGKEYLKNKLKSNNFFRKTQKNIRKFSQKIISRASICSIAKNTLICACSFVLTGFVCLLIQTRSPLSDVFTTGRISILKDRPANITRDIIVDMSALTTQGGIMTLTQELILDIVKKRPSWRFLVLVSKNLRHMYDFSETDNVQLIETNHFPITFIIMERVLKIKSFGMFHDKLTQLLYYDRVFFDRDCNLIWDPTGFSCCCRLKNIPKISTIHDTALFDISPIFLGGSIYILKSKMCMKNAILSSDKIVTISEFSQKRIYDKFNLPRNSVKLIPTQLGTRVCSDADGERSATVMNKYKIKSKKYFIFCSPWLRHKNHSSLIKAFNKFAEKNSDIKLILVGKHYDKFESRPIQEFSSDRLIISGFVPDEELGILLKNALAFIHPSVYEGFGMPIIEAMANGIPVACSNVASLPEVAGPAALLFDPFDVDSITQAMHRMADDSKLRKDLIQKGYDRAKKYSDRNAMVDEYIRVMEEVMTENDLRKAEKSR